MARKKVRGGRGGAAAAATPSATQSDALKAAEAEARNPRSATGVQANQANARDIKITNFSLMLHGTSLVTECDLEFNYGRRYGLLGLNGCGKSTLLQCIGHREVPIQEHIDIYLLDREEEASDKTALEAVVGDIEALVARLEHRAEELAMRPDVDSTEVSTELEELYDRIDELDPERARAKAARLLHGLGFSHADQSKATREFSGGWRMRIALAKALFIQPSMLLLDEPTNHLDLEACVWLEDYLCNWKSILVIISHSQDFMNGVCTNIIHMTQRTLRYYSGNYDTYVKARAELDVNQMKRFKWEQQQIAHMKSYIARFGHGNAKLARQAQSKEKVLAKMEAGGLTERPETEGTVKLAFTDVGELPPPVLQFQMVSFGYPGCELLYKDLELGIDLDSRVALVGRNGVGKSTLLKLMTGDLQPTDGGVRRHAHLKLGHYQQHLMEALDPEVTPLQYLMRMFPEVKEEQEMRTMMGRFGLSGSQQTQRISTLSDGLRCRIAFAMLAWQTPQILLLDEPTNHLDIETIDSLAFAINQWNGGMVLVSHDFRLINQVAYEIWVCGDKTVTPYKGDILGYKEELRSAMEAEEAASVHLL